jgi:tRNA pseudouridine65 synthase
VENGFEISILYQDEKIIVVDKAAGLAVHKNDFMPHDAPYLTKLLGEKTGQWIYNVHRLDAKTSGVMVLAFSTEMARELTLQFERKEVNKIYYSIVQGIPGDGTFSEKVIVKKKSKFKKPAVTHFKTMRSIQTAIAHNQPDPVYLSLIEIMPETGRWHQIRQHFARNRFDIVGDTHHGDFKFNRIVTEKTGVRRLLLHAGAMDFVHPEKKVQLKFTSSLPSDFETVLSTLEKK